MGTVESNASHPTRSTASPKHAGRAIAAVPQTKRTGRGTDSEPVTRLKGRFALLYRRNICFAALALLVSASIFLLLYSPFSSSCLELGGAS